MPVTISTPPTDYHSDLHYSASQSIKINDLYNLRDLGGLPGLAGRLTRTGRFFRSDLPEELSSDMQRFIRECSLRLVIDLRTDGEVGEKPSALNLPEQLRYMHISMIEAASVGQINKKIPMDVAYPLGELYRQTIGSVPSKMKQIFEAMAKVDEGAVLFHCAHGKDRTGILAALLLLLAAVPDDLIVENYAVSYENLKTILDPMIAAAPESRMLLRSDAENMRIFLNEFHKRYPSIDAYMEEIEISPAQTAALRSRLLD